MTTKTLGVAERNRIVEQNMPLVKKVAKAFMGRGRFDVGSSPEDLIQAGAIGLMMAVERYDSARAKFSTYAHRWIMREIRNAASSRNGIAFRNSSATDAFRLTRARSKLRSAGIIEPSPEQVVDSMGYTRVKRKRMIHTENLLRAHFSPPQFPLADQSGQKEGAEEASPLVVDLLRAVSRLSQKDMDFALCLYGLGGHPKLTPLEAADRFGVSRRAVYSWDLAVRRKIRRLMEEEGQSCAKDVA